MKIFSIIVAMDEKNGIGKEGGLAWHLAGDLKFFKKVTMETIDPTKKNAVIMGRKTWDSLPLKFKPLPGRLNVVLSQSLILPPEGNTLLFSNLDDSLKALNENSDIESIFVIGGAQVYQYVLAHTACRTLYLTHLKGDFGCDAFFPAIPAGFKLIKASAWFEENASFYRFCEYQKLT